MQAIIIDMFTGAVRIGFQPGAKLKSPIEKDTSASLSFKKQFQTICAEVRGAVEITAVAFWTLNLHDGRSVRVAFVSVHTQRSLALRAAQRNPAYIALRAAIAPDFRADAALDALPVNFV